MDPCQNKVNIVSNTLFTHFRISRIRSTSGKINGYVDDMEVISGLGVSLSLQATSVASRWLPRGRHDLHKSHATTLVTMLVALALAAVGSAAGPVAAVVAAVAVVRGTERWRVNAI